SFTSMTSVGMLRARRSSATCCATRSAWPSRVAKKTAALMTASDLLLVLHHSFHLFLHGFHLPLHRFHLLLRLGVHRHVAGAHVHLPACVTVLFGDRRRLRVFVLVRLRFLCSRDANAERKRRDGCHQ